MVAGAKSWTAAQDELGMNKSQIQRLVQRLADKLEVPRLLTELDGRPHVPAEFESLIDEVRDVLFKYTMIEEKANFARRIFLIRIDGYWSHIEQFWGEALGRFEQANPEIRIELAPWFGRNRDGAGAGLLADLKDKKVDLVIRAMGLRSCPQRFRPRQRQR